MADRDSTFARVEAQREVFERLRRDFEAGDRLALFEAMRLAARERCALPHWAAEAWLAACDDFVHGHVTTLQQRLGFSSDYNAPHVRARRRRAIDGRTAATLMDIVSAFQSSVVRGGKRAPRYSRTQVVAIVARRLGRSVAHINRAVALARKRGIA